MDGTRGDVGWIVIAVRSAASGSWALREETLKEGWYMMRGKWFATVWFAAGALCAASCVLAAEKDSVFRSGLYPGDRLASFKCRGVTGPEKGKPLCYI